MQRLINAYKAKPSPSNRKRLAAYLDKHIMAVVTATEEQLAFLRMHEFIR